MQGDGGGAGAGFVMIVILGLIYFVPSFLSGGRKHATGIILLNLFLGWTLIGWVGALVWAVSDEKMIAPFAAIADTKVCPKCAESVKVAALVCRFCGHEFAPPAAVPARADAGRNDSF